MEYNYSDLFIGFCIIRDNRNWYITEVDRDFVSIRSNEREQILYLYNFLEQINSDWIIHPKTIRKIRLNRLFI